MLRKVVRDLIQNFNSNCCQNELLYRVSRHKIRRYEDRVNGNFNFVPTESVCNRQKEVWQAPLKLFLISINSRVCLSVHLKTLISETIRTMTTKKGLSINQIRSSFGFGHALFCRMQYKILST